MAWRVRHEVAEDARERRRGNEAASQGALRDGEAPAAAADDGEGRRAGLSPGAAEDKREAREEEPVPVAPEKRHAITTRRSQRGEETEEEARKWRRESAAASDAEMHERDAQKEK